MRISEYIEFCISIDNQNNQQEGFYVKQKEGEREQGNGETERERACVCPLIETNDSIDQHPQQPR
jgi:hypothetical protein